jgi:ribosomal protein RSM22 (predicted rRNA methylase)
VVADLPAELRDGLVAALDAVPEERLAVAVRRLMEQYRTGPPATAPILASDLDVAAYAAYRMPATFAATRGALGHLRAVLPGFQPARLVDVGGGTGAAAWAATDTFPGLTAVTVLDQVPGALALGERLASSAASPALRAAQWRPWRIEPDAALPAADLVTIAYVLGELPPPVRAAIVARAAVIARAAPSRAVVVVEPGTPAGFERIVAARDVLTGSGLTVLAPCPHQRACPLAGTRDWCHFAARVNRSALHRRLKAARLGHEDEKYAYVAAVHAPAGAPAPGRVLRHPRYRKGLVTLQVCQASDGVAPVPVSKRQGDLYRAARDVGWGDAWPVP